MVVIVRRDEEVDIDWRALVSADTQPQLNIGEDQVDVGHPPRCLVGDRLLVGGGAVIVGDAKRTNRRVGVLDPC